jgi:uncharacterized protein (DUF1015 family)
MQEPVLQPAEILLPQQGTDLALWAVLACDQYTSQPEYWQDVKKLVGSAPSTLRIILPEVYLEEPDVPTCIEKIHAAMREYMAAPLTRKVQGYIYVERTCAGHVRQGLVGCVDLKDYSYEKGASPRIRPSENTVVERIPPRLAVRREAPLESPHILMLADDEEQSIIEPLAAKKSGLEPLYDIDLMLDGGNAKGWAITNPADLDAIATAMAKLDDTQRFTGLYGADAKVKPFALAVGDGNHSLATAKAYWEEIKERLPQDEWENHPARYCLVEMENVQSPAIEIEPIHRVLFNAEAASLLKSAAVFAGVYNAEIVPAGQGQHEFVGMQGAGSQTLSIKNPPHALAVGTLEMFLQDYLEHHPKVRVDYVHGEDAVRGLVAEGAVGILLPPVRKSDLFLGVAQGGVLPKKTFSMGHANEKRYYLECRKIEK